MAAAAAAQRCLLLLLLVAMPFMLLTTISLASAQSLEPFAINSTDSSPADADSSAPATSTNSSSSPPANYTVSNVTQALNASGNFGVFLSLAAEANITSKLQEFLDSTSGNTSGVTAFVPLDSAFTPQIVSAYRNLSAANQSNLLLYHVLSQYYNRSQLVALSINLTTLAGVLNNSTTGYRLVAVNQSSSSSNDSTITVYASGSAANVSSANISGIPNPPNIAIYPIQSVLLPLEIFPANSSSSSSASSSNKSSSPAPAPAASPSAASSISTISIMSSLLLMLQLGAIALKY